MMKEFEDTRQIPGEGVRFTPVMVQDGAFEQERVSSRFKRHAADIDPEITSFVVKKLAEYSD